MEIGIGIHGEPGRDASKVGSAHEIVEMLATAVVDDLPYKSGDSVLAFVNGMGGTPLIELYVVYNELKVPGRPRDLGGAEPDRLLHHVARDAGVLHHAGEAGRRAHALWDAPVKTPGLRWGSDRGGGWSTMGERTSSAGPTEEVTWRLVRRRGPVRPVYAEVIAEQKEELTALDTAIGDGDHGINMDRGMQAAVAKLDGAEHGDIGGLSRPSG